MPEKSKICVEIPFYLKTWIDDHDLGQNALVTLGLRMIYLQEQNVSADKIVSEIKNYFESKKLPF
jgi:hypothetical protein